MALVFLYFFRIAAITVYMISGWFGDSYVLTVAILNYSILLTDLLHCRRQTVVVVVLLAMDFWNCRVKPFICIVSP